MATRARRVNFGEGRWRRMTLLLLTRHDCGGVGGIFLLVRHSIPPFVYIFVPMRISRRFPMRQISLLVECDRIGVCRT